MGLFPNLSATLYDVTKLCCKVYTEQNIQLRREINAKSLFECEMRNFTCVPSFDIAFSWSDKHLNSSLLPSVFLRMVFYLPVLL